VDGLELLHVICASVGGTWVVREELDVVTAVVDVVMHHDPHRLLQCVLAHLRHGELLPIRGVHEWHGCAALKAF
jgi:hypothetical protein